MRYSRIIILLCVVSAFVTLSGVNALSQVTINPAGPLFYNVFQVADLGLQGGGRGNRDFKINIGPNPGGTQAITVEVRDDVTGDLLVSGQTDPFPQGQLEGSHFIGEIDDKFGGEFDVEDPGTGIYDKVLATGVLPRGRYSITVGLSPGPAASATLIVEIVPPYVQPLFPVDMQTTRDLLDFRWVSNIQRQELHIYTDRAGNKEVLGGSRLPYTKIGGVAGKPQGQNVSGSFIAPLLKNGGMYYWQIHGYIVTSHGDERKESVLTAFQYFEEKKDIEYIGLSEPDKKAIMDALIQMLIAVMGEKNGGKAAKTLDGYGINSISLDGSPISREEIMCLLEAIIAGRARATEIDLR